MDHSTRLQYLEAMGIDVWIPRNQALVEQVKPVVADNLQEIAQFKANSDLAGNEWSVLENQVTACQQCVLCDTRTRIVFGAGYQKADWMLIGEAPGENEEIQGQPFMGAEGYLLTEMIRAVGLQREEVFITNLLKCRPPEDRDPKVKEIHACSGYLQRQIALVQPKIILAVGRAAAQSLLNTKEPLSKLRNVPHQLYGLPLVVVYHPAYLIRSLLEKRKAWQDLKLAMKIYQELEK